MRTLPHDLQLESVRAGASAHFDNGARLRTESRVQAWWERLRGQIPQELYHLLEDSPRGGVARHCLEVGGQDYHASVSSIEFAAMAGALWRALDPGARVIEIGGGYGGLASAMLRARPDLAWTIIETPDVARVTRWYLADTPQTRVVTSLDGLEPADLVVQTRGFMEMEPHVLRYYFAAIQDGRLLKDGGQLYTINRLKKISRFADYPFDQRWAVVFRRPWLESHPMLEALLQRTPTPSG